MSEQELIAKRLAKASRQLSCAIEETTNQDLKQRLDAAVCLLAVIQTDIDSGEYL